MAIPAFLSYSHRDRHLAGLIKSQIDHYGFDTFLAHEDLQPSVEWQRVILRRLKDCVVFLPLLTQSFKRSDWTDQETGIAVALGKICVPLKVDLNPYGFVSRYQAQSFEEGANLSDACWNIVKTLASHRKIAGAVKDGVIAAFGRSGTFRGAAEFAEKLELLEPFTADQLNEIIRLSCDNDQIWHGFDARAYVNSLIKREKKRVIKLLAKKFAELQRT